MSSKWRRRRRGAEGALDALAIVGAAPWIDRHHGRPRSRRGVSPRDPGAFVAALLVMLGTTLAACLVPGVRAARTDIVKALRV